MNKIEEQARSALAAAKSFHQERQDTGKGWTTEDRQKFGRMVDTAEQAADQLAAFRRVEGLEDRLTLWDDKAAEQHQATQKALPESLRDEPDIADQIRLAIRDKNPAPLQYDLDFGRAAKWMALTEQGATKEELALVVGTPRLGGYWTPDYWERVIVTEWRRIEGVSQVITPMVTGDGNTLYFQQRTQIYPGSTAISHSTDVSTYQVGEQGAHRTDMEPEYARVQLEVWKYTQKQAVSSELLEDSFINVPEEVGSFAGQWFGELMEQAFTNGTGSGQPKGVFHGIVSAQEVETNATGNPTLTDFHKLIYGDKRLRSGRNNYSVLTSRGVWGEAVRNINTNYLPWWGVDLNSEGQMMAFGYPVVFGTFINPSIAANSNPVGFGNWQRYLRTRIVNGMRMTVSDIAESDTDEVTFRFRIRFGSQLTDANQGVFLSVHS